MKTLILSLLFFLLIRAHAQEALLLNENSMPGIEKINTRHYDYDGLWGYINGGADLYFEYGFNSVTVQDIKISGSEFKVDIYRMKSPEAAYGIYSVSRFRCLHSNLLNQFDCSTPYQYIAARGNYFLSIANSTGSKEDLDTGLKIAQKYLEMMGEPSMKIPGIFNDSIFEQGLDDLKLIYGPLGMQNGFVRWDEMFTGFHDYEAWVIPAEIYSTKFNLGYIKFQNEETLSRFITKNNLIISNLADLETSVEIKKYAFILEDGVLVYDGKLPQELLLTLNDLVKAW
jgi:hypothetical protein